MTTPASDAPWISARRRPAVIRPSCRASRRDYATMGAVLGSCKTGRTWVRTSSRALPDQRRQHREPREPDHGQRDGDRHGNGPAPVRPGAPHDQRGGGRQAQPQGDGQPGTARRAARAGGQELDPLCPELRRDHQRYTDDGCRRAQRDTQRPPLPPRREPQQAHAACRLGQEHERPRPGVSKPEHDGRGDEQVHVAVVQLDDHRRECQDQQRAPATQPDRGRQQHRHPQPQEHPPVEPTNSLHDQVRTVGCR